MSLNKAKDKIIYIEKKKEYHINPFKTFYNGLNKKKK